MGLWNQLRAPQAAHLLHLERAKLLTLQSGPSHF